MAPLPHVKVLYHGINGEVITVGADYQAATDDYALNFTSVINIGAATIADGADVTQGAIADVGVSTDAVGTVNAHLRGLIKLLLAGTGLIGRAATEVTPAPQASANAGMADVAGSTLDTLHNMAVSYTLINTGGNSLDWQVVAANDVAFAGAVVVQASATVLSAGIGTYSATVAAWRYYKLQIVDTVGGSHGQATVHGVTKG
jgi:hypothetical protein